MTKAIVDGSIVLGAMSAPLWLQVVEQGLGLFMLVGGAGLLVGRLILLRRELKAAKSKQEE